MERRVSKTEELDTWLKKMVETVDLGG